MHLHARIAGTIGVMIALITAGLAGTAQVAAAASGVVGHVYVNDNTAGTNTIGGVGEHADRTPTAMSGSPFTAGGAAAAPPPRGPGAAPGRPGGARPAAA